MKLQEKVQKNIVELLKHIKTGISSSTAPSKTNNRVRFLCINDEFI